MQLLVLNTKTSINRLFKKKEGKRLVTQGPPTKKKLKEYFEETIYHPRQETNPI